MKTIVSTAYKNQESKLLEFIEDFRNQGETIYGGARNTLKTFSLGDSKITIKAFQKPNFINRVVYKHFRKSKAERSYEHAEKLLKLDIGTPEPIAYMEFSNAVSFLESYYICKYIDYDITYRELVENPNLPNHEEILRAFTRFTFKMHEAGIFFKDHSPGNTLICFNKGAYQFYLVDLNRMVFKTLDFEDRMENMKRLTPEKDMVAVMANEYAKLYSKNEQIVFDTLWSNTTQFQTKFHRKRQLKKRLLFWR